MWRLMRSPDLILMRVILLCKWRPSGIKDGFSISPLNHISDRSVKVKNVAKADWSFTIIFVIVTKSRMFTLDA